MPAIVSVEIDGETLDVDTLNWASNYIQAHASQFSVPAPPDPGAASSGVPG